MNELDEVEALTSQINVLKELLQKSRTTPQGTSAHGSAAKISARKRARNPTASGVQTLYQRSQANLKQALQERDRLYQDNQTLHHDLKIARSYSEELNQELELLYGQMQTLKVAYQKAEEERLLLADQQQQQSQAQQASTEQLEQLEQELER